MIKVLIPVILLAIIALVVLVIHKRESKVGELKRLREENKSLKSLVQAIDNDAQAEYAVTNNLFAMGVLNRVSRHNEKEIA